MINSAHLKLVDRKHPALRRVCDAVDVAGGVSTEVRGVAWAMARVMVQHKGVGLAAPQLGVAWRVIVVSCGLRDPFLWPPTAWPTSQAPVDPCVDGACVVINPVLSEHSAETELAWEGCLTFKGLRKRIRRHVSVRVKGLDTLGRPVDFVARGYAARVVQHECDHLEGKVIADYQEEGPGARGQGPGIREAEALGGAVGAAAPASQIGGAKC